MSQEAAGCLSCSSGSITSTTQSAFESLKLCLGHPTNFWYTRDHHPKLHTNHLKVETTDQWCLHSFQDYSCMRFLETIVFLRHSWSFWNVNKLPCQRPEAVQHHLGVQGRVSTHGTTFTMPMPQSTGNWSPSLSKGSSDVKGPITNCRCRWAPQKSGKGVLSHRRHIRKAPNCGDADVIVNIPGKPPVKSTRNGLMMTNYWWLMLYPHRIKVKFSDRFSGSIAICHHSSWLISRWSLFPSTSTRTPVKAKINAPSFTQIASATGMSENMVPGPQIHWWIIIFIHLPYKNMAMWSHLGPHFFDSPISWLVKVTFVKACWILCRTDQLSGKNQVLLDELLIATGHCWNTSVSQWNWLLCIPVYPVFTHTHTPILIAW